LGDITQEHVDAIVNSANRSLRSGGGLDKLIHLRGGPQIEAECRAYGGCPVGLSVVTSGGNLPARLVIHAVGPQWRGGWYGEDEALVSAYRESLRLAAAHGVKTIAFPPISMRTYRYPIPRGAYLAVKTIRDFLASNQTLEEVRLVTVTPEEYEAFSKAITGELPAPEPTPPRPPRTEPPASESSKTMRYLYPEGWDAKDDRTRG
jgi:O-acetyl-ADP-ribose deacetylase (regulator of RNase III)